MSHLISLCSQKCSSGRLNRVVQWLYGECKCDGPVTDQTLEFRLALGIAKAGGIGCTYGDGLDAAAALCSLSEYCKQFHDKVMIKKVQARALGCVACFMLWGKELALNPGMTLQNGVLAPHISIVDEMIGLNGEQSIDLLSQAADLGDSFAAFNLSFFSRYIYGSQSINKAIELYQIAAEMGNTNAMFNLAIYQ